MSPFLSHCHSWVMLCIFGFLFNLGFVNLKFYCSEDFIWLLSLTSISYSTTSIPNYRWRAPGTSYPIKIWSFYSHNCFSSKKRSTLSTQQFSCSLFPENKILAPQCTAIALKNLQINKLLCAIWPTTKSPRQNYSVKLFNFIWIFLQPFWLSLPVFLSRPLYHNIFHVTARDRIEKISL